MVSNPYFTEVLARAHADDLRMEARKRDQLDRAAVAFPPLLWRPAARKGPAATDLRDLIEKFVPRPRRWADLSAAVARGSGGCG